MENKSYLRSVIKGTIGTILFLLIGVAILSCVMTKIILSRNTFNMVYVIISLISLSLGSIIAAKRNGSKGLVVGVSVAVSSFIVTLILTSLLNGEITFNGFSFLKFTVALVVGGLSGILGVNI